MKSRLLIVAIAAALIAVGYSQLRKTRANGASSADQPRQAQAEVEGLVALDPKNFDRPTRIDNKWFPLQPGTRYVYEGFTMDEGVKVPHRLVFTVTDLTKMVGGVRAVVGFDQDFSDGELAEAELVFFAQDNDGNVWHLGQYPEEYDAGKLVAAPAWLHGFEDAKAGIIMPADPKLGAPSYPQGWGPAVGWTDRGEVHQTGQKTCVPADCYQPVLVIRETSQAEPDAYQLKFHAQGVGVVRVGWGGQGEKTQETLELVKVEQLSPQALAKERALALDLEKRAYKNSKNVYAHTSPAEQQLGAKGQ